VLELSVGTILDLKSPGDCLVPQESGGVLAAFSCPAQDWSCSATSTSEVENGLLIASERSWYHYRQTVDMEGWILPREKVYAERVLPSHILSSHF